MSEAFEGAPPGEAGRRVIALMAKAPLPGAVKTRLSGLLGTEGAAELYAAFLADTVAAARRVAEATVRIVCPDEEHRRVLAEIVGPDVGVLAQARPGLMAGLGWAFGTHFAGRAAKVLLISADSPTRPATAFAEALRRLDATDVCVGPCPDGGYHLIGARRDCPGLFDGVATSTAGTLAQTIARARELGLSTSFLPAWRDVDTAEDFEALVAELRATPDGAPATRAWLAHTGWL